MKFFFSITLLLLMPVFSYNMDILYINDTQLYNDTNYTLVNYNNYQLKNKFNGTICDICLDIVSIINYEINESNKTINETEKLVKKLCKLLGNNKTKEECNHIINDINLIKNMILMGLNPGDICQRIGFCSGFLFLLLMKLSSN